MCRYMNFDVNVRFIRNPNAGYVAMCHTHTQGPALAHNSFVSLILILFWQIYSQSVVCMRQP